MEGGGLRSAAVNSNGSGIGMNHRWEKNHKVGLMGTAIRRNRLSDITNTVSSARPGEPSMEGDQENSNVVPCPSTKGYVAQLMKENTALLKLVGERNKIIEMTSIEMQRLRFELQKLRQQNWQLAQANSQMQAELNLGKDRLKALQHELRCMKAVLKVKSLEVEEKEKLNQKMCENIGCEEGHKKCAEVAVDASHQANDMKMCNANRKRTSKEPQGSTAMTHEEVAPKEKVERRKSLRRRSGNLKSESCEPMVDLIKIEDAKEVQSLVGEPLHEDTSLHEEVAPKEKVERRKSLRRRSGNLKSESCEPMVDLIKIEDAKVVHSLVREPLHEDTAVHPDIPAPSCSDASMKQGKNEEQNGRSDSSQSCNQEVRRSSVGRPLRKAAEKVTSYKERPIHVKLRRVE
ncbi:shugoshin-1-like isoform X2 [Phoenix dactylifera]|uniref:Shugoshin-1-like isoform X2 n=1 Tax=Phoenix dactylifera TaxID=42345 RepID=A0A8B8ZC47_PHODC|nr:shugoshin-1-like isoform X2 [Phoenix dactylifera]